MYSQVIAVSETFATYITGERLLARMDLIMLLEDVLLVESLVANVTGVGLRVTVDYVVHLEAAAGHERLLAHVTGVLLDGDVKVLRFRHFERREEFVALGLVAVN